VIHVAVERVSDSCGMSVPYFDYVGHRSQLDDWASRKRDAGLDAYRREKNQKSLDGLPGYRYS
jgi:hypothetical protein